MDGEAETTLEMRAGLPDALRVLVEELPRGTWEAHPNFTPLTRFWLDRHLMFRRALGQMIEGSRAFLDDRREAGRHGAETARLAQFFLGELHAHHSIEDQHYFPALIGLDSRLERGFGLLDADHQALDGHMAGLADDINAMLRGLAGEDPKRGAAVLDARLAAFERFLDRHLTDEEELVVPVILAHAPEIG